MKHQFIIACLLLLNSAFSLSAQDSIKAKEEGFVFETIYDIAASPVKDQYRSGTCWSFATTSFVESELLKTGQDTLDLSEMFFVNYAYRQKAEKYVRLHGNANFGPGGQAHDVLNVIKTYGFAPEQAYTGLIIGETKHNHAELDKVLKSYLDAVIANEGGKLSQVWPNAYLALLSAYLSPTPEKISIKNKEISPEQFAKETGFNASDYIELTSYTHHPYYTQFDLEIPDNWSHDLYYNIPMEEMVQVMNYAFEKGYTVCWDGDVSDKGFSHTNGVAIVPEKETKNMDGTERTRWEKLSEREKNAELYNFKTPGTEKQITAEMRQEAFNNYQATDDHLMHMTGMVKDQNGTIYYKTKNSWASGSNKYGGYLNISESYFRLNTISIMVNRNAIPQTIKKKLNL